MLGRIVERDRVIEMGASLCEVPGMQERQTHDAAPDHEGPGRALFFRQRRKLGGERTHHVAVEGDKVRDPHAIENGEQQHGIFSRLSESVRSFDEKTRPVDGGSGLWRRIASQMKQRRYELHLELDLIVAERWRAWQGRDQVERARQLF